MRNLNENIATYEFIYATYMLQQLGIEQARSEGALKMNATLSRTVWVGLDPMSTFLQVDRVYRLQLEGEKMGIWYHLDSFVDA